MTSEDTAWVTLATNDGYAVGALVLAYSLRNVATLHKLHVLYTSGVSLNLRNKLKEVFDASTEVNVLDSGDETNLDLIGRPDLGITFTKLHCWKLIMYSKCVFLDADTFVVKNCDELGWREWDADHRLPFTYNVTSGAIYAYAAALKRFAPQIKIVHFLGKRKPWLVHYESGSKGLNFLSNYHQVNFIIILSQFFKEWHDVYSHMLQEHLPDHPKVSQACNQRDSHSMSDVLTYSSCPFGSITSARKEMSQLEAWEAGNPDYLGFSCLLFKFEILR